MTSIVWYGFHPFIGVESHLTAVPGTFRVSQCAEGWRHVWRLGFLGRSLWGLRACLLICFDILLPCFGCLPSSPSFFLSVVRTFLFVKSLCFLHNNAQFISFGMDLNAEMNLAEDSSKFSSACTVQFVNEQVSKQLNTHI